MIPKTSPISSLIWNSKFWLRFSGSWHWLIGYYQSASWLWHVPLLGSPAWIYANSSTFSDSSVAPAVGCASVPPACASIAFIIMCI